MIYFGYLLLGFGLIRLVIAFVNLISRLYLPKSLITVDEPLVSILIPARNEEFNIGNLLEDIHTGISYKNYEVIVCNDASTDNTTQVIQKYIDKNRKIRLIDGLPLESGWMGKSFACRQLADNAKGQYYLFLDADVRVGGNLIQKAVCHVKKYNTGLLSIFPQQILDNRGAWLSVPLMNRILLSLLPLILIRISSWVSFSAANGQFMLFDADVYKTMQPHAACKSSKAEDIAICRYYKGNKIAVSTLLGNYNIRCCMYGSLNEAVKGFSKNVLAFFGNSITVALLYAVFTSFAALVLFLVFGPVIALLYIASIIMMQLFISAAGHQNICINMLLMPLQHLVFLRIIFSAIAKRRNKSLKWKGRNISRL